MTTSLGLPILGIMQAGAAYLPMAPGYPPERIGYMITDSGTNLLVTTRDLIESKKLKKWEIKTIFLDVAKKIGTEFAQTKTKAKIWGGGAKFPAQEVSLKTKIKEGMMIRFL